MQSPAVLVTSRRVQNVHTGLDLTVPQHQEVRGKMMSGHVEYQILVVTRLAAFKSAKHRPEDVVQFLVSWGLCQDAPEGAQGPGGQAHRHTCHWGVSSTRERALL
uniref:Uncharacterized protein n=1 Tax=Ailuropoda melanoleuca TaxID=9646 RepID=A0A7N5JW88_AILME